MIQQIKGTMALNNQQEKQQIILLVRSGASCGGIVRDLQTVVTVLCYVITP